jgi:SagB-type dehydrogenase family enzyme
MSKLEAVSLFDAFDRRKTVRQFNPTTVTKQSFSNLIFTGFGYFHQHKSSEKEYKEFKRRASPSGGCLQAIEPYILVFDVEGIAPGIYWYDAEHHALCLMDNEVSYEQVSDMLASQFFSNDCSFSVFLTANLEIFTWKYRTTRSYRVVNLEVGHFSQTLQLAAVSEGLNTWITGAFDDELIEKCLGLEETKNIPLFYLAFGKGVYRAMNPLLDERREQYLKDHPNIGR